MNKTKVNINNLSIVKIEEDGDWDGIYKYYKVRLCVKGEDYCKVFIDNDGSEYMENLYFADVTIDLRSGSTYALYYYSNLFEYEYIGEYEDDEFCDWLVKQIEMRF